MRVIVITPNKKEFFVYNNPDIRIRYEEESQCDTMGIKTQNREDTYTDIPSDVAIEIVSILRGEKETYVIDFSKLMKKGVNQ